MARHVQEVEVSPKDNSGSIDDQGLNRRQILKGLGVGGALLAGAPLLAACGSSSKSNSTATTAPAGGGSTGGSASGSIKDILNFIGTVDPAHSGKGMTLDMGGVLAFTGPGAFFGRTMSNGMKLGAKHIAALGGPNYNLIFKDHKSGDPQAGVSAAKELGFAHVPTMLASYVDDLGAMLPLQAQYKIFTLDGGGGTSQFGKGKPLFWGSRAITPDDPLPGVAKFLQQKLPQVKKVTVDAWDLGVYNKLIQAQYKQQLATVGVQLGQYVTTPVGATDYSTAIAQIKADQPDMVMLAIFGNDIGVFMKQYIASGINKPCMAAEYTQPSADLAGSAYNNLYLAFDYFNADKPDNGWSKIFIDAFKKGYGANPDYYAANYYEDMFIQWEVLRRTLAKGGDPKDGDALNQSFMDKMEFPSVYGGTATAAGTIAFDPTTHSVSKRPMTVSQYRSGKVVPLAYVDIGGADYRLA
jgi:branched-chain amino acid transport system substrate-binding protein